MIIGTQTLEAVVYKITNLINGREYIGVSIDFERRMKQHKCSPPKNMVKDLETYNFVDNFDKEIIFQGTEDECYNKEKLLVSKNKKPYYNSIAGGQTGTGMIGEDNHQSKLKEEDVIQIREIYTNGTPQKEIAEKYNISISVISGIVTGKNWKHVGGTISELRANSVGENSPSSKLSNKEIKEIRNIAKNTNKNNKEIAKLFNISRTYCGDIILGNTRLESGGPINNIDYTRQKLTYITIPEEDVKNIRIQARDTKDTYQYIANIYNISKEYVGNLVLGKARKECAGPILGIDYTNKRLTCEEVENIRKIAKNTNQSFNTIAESYNITSGYVGEIVRGVKKKKCKGPISGIDYKIKNRSIKISEDIVTAIRNKAFSTKDTYVKIAEEFDVFYKTVSAIVRGKSRIEVGGPILGKDYMKRGEGAL